MSLDDVRRLKVGSDCDSRILTGNEFQTLGAEDRKARDPNGKCNKKWKWVHDMVSWLPAVHAEAAQDRIIL